MSLKKSTTASLGLLATSAVATVLYGAHSFYNFSVAWAELAARYEAAGPEDYVPSPWDVYPTIFAFQLVDTVGSLLLVGGLMIFLWALRQRQS